MLGISFITSNYWSAISEAEQPIVAAACSSRQTDPRTRNLYLSSVASFLADPKHRNVDVQIGEMTSHEVVSRVKGGLATLGVCWAETDMAGVEWKPSKRDHLSAVVPINHPLANKERIAFADTLEYEQVGIHLGGPVTHLLRRESVRAGKPLRYRIMAPTFDAMIRIVESGLVVAIMPAAVALRYARGSGDRRDSTDRRLEQSVSSPSVAGAAARCRGRLPNCIVTWRPVWTNQAQNCRQPDEHG